MKTISFDSNYGRFNYTITATIGDDVNAATEALCVEGLGNCGFRGCGSSVDKALVAAKLTTKEAKRNETVYSDEAVAVINKAAQAKLDSFASLPTMAFKVTGEHVFDESASPMVRATTLVDSLFGTDNEATLRTTLGIFDARAVDAERDVLIEIANKAGLGIQPPKAKK